MDEIRVLNFGTYLAGPLTAKYLQQMGAKIITVKPPKSHHQYRKERAWNQNVCDELEEGHIVHHIDLKTSTDSIFELLKHTDILIENFRPGVMDKLGLSCEECVKHNSNLIYVSIPGFNRSDKEYRDVQAWESVVLAVSGVFKDMGLNRQLMKIPASYSALPLASTYASIFAAFAAVSKYFLYKRSGRCGDNQVEVSLASALSEALVHNTINFPKPYSYLNLRNRIISRDYFEKMSYDQIIQELDPFFCHYICSDQRPFYLVCPSHLRHQEKVIGILEVDIRMTFADPYDKDTGRKYGMGGNQIGAQAHMLRSLFSEKFKMKTSFEWEKIFGDAGVPTSAHRSFNEWLISPHALDSGLSHMRDDGSMKAGPLAWLKELQDADGSHLYAQNPIYCLSGITIIDCSNVIAGPTIGMMLARMGANVIKVDNTTTLYAPNITIIYGLSANQEKRSILLDIKSEEFRILVKSAQAILVNTTSNRLRPLGLDMETLQRVNPNIILIQFDAWSGPHEKGFMCNYLGYDDNIQAATGIMERFGGGLDSVEEHAHIGTVDVIAGVAGAFSTVCSFIELLVKNRSSVARCSLASVSQQLQFMFSCGSHENLTIKARESFDRLGSFCRGEHMLHRCYETASGWCLFIATHHYDRKVVFELLNKIGKKIPLSFANEYFVEFFKSKTIDELQRVLRGCVVVPLKSMSDIRTLYTMDTCNFDGGSYQFLVSSHEVGTLTMIAPIAMRTSHIRTVMKPAPKYGEDVTSVNDEFHLMIKHTEWNNGYLPYADTCPICLETVTKQFTIECNHIICVKCATLCSFEGMSRCPLCRSENDLNAKQIQKKVQEFRSLYTQWRKGNAKGANDMERIRRRQISHSYSFSC